MTFRLGRFILTSPRMPRACQLKMVSEQRIKRAFMRVKKGMEEIRYSTSNNLRYLNVLVKEQDIRIKELERRLAQIERLSLRKVMGEEDGF